MIVNDCLAALVGINKIEKIAIYARRLDAAQSIASAYGIEKVYTDYEKFLEDESFDTVYIGITNDLHHCFSERALKAGKNVVLEKPFTVTLDEAQSLVKLAKKNNLYLFEAITTIYLPNFKDVKRRMGEIGDIKMVTCNFSQYSSRYDRYLNGDVSPSFDALRSGGALYDLNVYNVHLVVGLLGSPKKVSYHPNAGYTGVDTSGVLLLEYDGFSAVLIAAKDSTSPCHATIQGNKGYLKLDGPPNECPKVEVYLDKKAQSYNNNVYTNRMVEQFLAFEKIMNEGDFQACYEQLGHSIEVMHVIEEARLYCNKL